MKERWNRLSKKEQWLRALQILFSVAAILAASLQLSGIWHRANLLTVPCVGMAVLLQSFAEWKRNRATAVFGFLGAASVFVMYGIGIILD